MVRYVANRLQRTVRIAAAEHDHRRETRSWLIELRDVRQEDQESEHVGHRPQQEPNTALKRGHGSASPDDQAKADEDGHRGGHPQGLAYGNAERTKLKPDTVSQNREDCHDGGNDDEKINNR